MSQQWLEHTADLKIIVLWFTEQDVEMEHAESFLECQHDATEQLAGSNKPEIAIETFNRSQARGAVGSITGQPKQIRIDCRFVFAVRGHLDDSGRFWTILDDSGRKSPPGTAISDFGASPNRTPIMQ